MDYPIIDRYGFNQRISTAFKLMAILAGIWLLNVLFVAVHEGGHSAVAASFGSHIYNVYISPTGLEGATTHEQLRDQAQTDIVLAAGVAASTLAIVIAYLIRLEIAVYVLGLRTVESLLNYSTGSDMLCLLKNIGPDAYILSAALILVAAAFVGLCVRKRFIVMRSSKVGRSPVSSRPAPAQAV